MQTCFTIEEMYLNRFVNMLRWNWNASWGEITFHLCVCVCIVMFLWCNLEIEIIFNIFPTFCPLPISHSQSVGFCGMKTNACVCVWVYLLLTANSLLPSSICNRSKLNKADLFVSLTWNEIDKREKEKNKFYWDRVYWS